MQRIPVEEMRIIEKDAKMYPDVMSDVIYSNLKMELITEKAKNKMLMDIIDELRRITGIQAGRFDQTDFRPQEQINYLQSQSMERDQKKLNEVEINYCLSFMGGNLLEKNGIKRD